MNAMMIPITVRIKLNPGAAGVGVGIEVDVFVFICAIVTVGVIEGLKTVGLAAGVEIGGITMIF